MVKYKIKSVPDEICEGCSQNWQEECRAYNMPQSKEERKQRKQGNSVNCDGDPRVKLFRYSS